MANDIFNGDVTSRYSEQMEPGRYSWRQAESDLTRDVFEKPGESVAGLAWNFEQTHVDKVANLLANGDFAAAKEDYDKLRESIRLNWDGLSTMAQMQGDGYGPMSNQIGAKARAILGGAFNQREVVLSDGSKTTIGRALADNSPFLAGKSEELSSFGFGTNATDLYLKNDKVIKSVMDPLLRSSHSGVPVANRLQLIELAEDYANNKERVDGVFGDGAQRFMDYIRDTHQTSGCAAHTFRTLLDFAEDYSGKTGVAGKQLASDVVGGYNDLVASTFQGDPQIGRDGVRRPAEITDDQRRMFDATLLPALKMTLEGLDDRTPVDLRDPRLKRSLLDVMDVVAYSKAQGSDILSDCRNAGYDVNAALGGFVRNALLDMEQPSDNIVEGVRRLRSDMLGRITGGRSPQRVDAQLSGRAEDYMKGVERRTGVRSLCPEADGMADTIHGYLLRELTPAMAKGQLYPDAARANPAKMVDGLARKLSRSFYGPGRGLAAQAVAQAALFGATAPNGDVLSQGFMNGGQVNVEELIATLAFSPGSDANDPMIASLRSWYSGNVAMDLQFGKRRAKLRDSLLSDGIPDAQARMIVSSASSLAAQNLSRGIDPSFVFDNAESQGVYLTLKDGTDAEGRPAKVVGYSQGNRDKASIPLDDDGKDVLPAGTFLSNRALWTQVQQMLTARLKREAAKADYAARQRIKNASEEQESQLD